MKSIVIVDDHVLFRLGIKGSLIGTDIKVVGEAGSAKELFNLLPAVKPDVILLDIILPDLSGIEIAQRLQKEYPDLKILILSSECNMEVVSKLINTNIDGFVSKVQCNTETLTCAIDTICNGFQYFGKDIAQLIHAIYIAKKNNREIVKEFTERELEIIKLCHKGLLSKQIAQELNISTRTVDTHKQNIFKKMGITRTYDMVLYALNNGIISLSN